MTKKEYDMETLFLLDVGQNLVFDDENKLKQIIKSLHQKTVPGVNLEYMVSSKEYVIQTEDNIKKYIEVKRLSTKTQKEYNEELD